MFHIEALTAVLNLEVLYCRIGVLMKSRSVDGMLFCCAHCLVCVCVIIRACRRAYLLQIFDILKEGALVSEIDKCCVDYSN